MMARKTSGTPCPVLALMARTSAGIDPQAGQDLFLDLLGPGRLHVDLVEDRHDRQVVVHRQVGVGDGLGLHALGGVDQQDRPLAGRQAARDLVVKVDVAGRVDQVQLVDLPVERVIDRDRPGLDGDSALALQVHVVEQLLAKLARRDGARLQEELVGQRALTVIDMGDDREISDELRVNNHVCESSSLSLGKASIGNATRCRSRVVHGSRIGVDAAFGPESDEISDDPGSLYNRVGQDRMPGREG